MNPSEFRTSKADIAAALAYPIVFLVLYFALVAHLRFGLGRWPTHISDNPATGLFHLHSVTAALLFYIGALLVPLGAALAIVLAVIGRTRRIAVCIAVFSVAGILAFLAMRLAPNSFVTWWWD